MLGIHLLVYCKDLKKNEIFTEVKKNSRGWKPVAALVCWSIEHYLANFNVKSNVVLKYNVTNIFKAVAS